MVMLSCLVLLMHAILLAWTKYTDHTGLYKMLWTVAALSVFCLGFAL